MKNLAIKFNTLLIITSMCVASLQAQPTKARPHHKLCTENQAKQMTERLLNRLELSEETSAAILPIHQNFLTKKQILSTDYIDSYHEMQVAFEDDLITHIPEQQREKVSRILRRVRRKVKHRMMDVSTMRRVDDHHSEGISEKINDRVQRMSDRMATVLSRRLDLEEESIEKVKILVSNHITQLVSLRQGHHKDMRALHSDLEQEVIKALPTDKREQYQKMMKNKHRHHLVRHDQHPRRQRGE